MSTNLVETISTLDSMATAAAEAKEISTENRRVYALAHKLLAQDTLTLDDTLRTALVAFTDQDQSGSVDRAEGNRLAEMLGNAIIGVNAGLPAPKGFTIEGAQSAIDKWKANGGGRSGGSGTTVPDAPGRVVMAFTYPNGMESVKPVGRDGNYTLHAEQQAIRSNLLWEITKRAKALNGTPENERKGYVWPDSERQAWRDFYDNCVKANVEGSVTLDMPVNDGVMSVEITYKV